MKKKNPRPSIYTEEQEEVIFENKIPALKGQNIWRSTMKNQKKKNGISIQEKHFKIFKEECERWVKITGIENWFISYELNKNIDVDGNLAHVMYHLEDRLVTITLNANYDEGRIPTDDEIKRAAFHEVWEIVFARLQYLAKERFCNEKEINDSRHEIIRILENVLWTKYSD
jgi:hypothetical protein